VVRDKSAEATQKEEAQLSQKPDVTKDLKKKETSETIKMKDVKVVKDPSKTRR